MNSRTRIRPVPELGLDLIDHEGIFQIGFGLAAGQMHGGFLVGHAQQHVPAEPVFEAEQFASHRFKTAGFLPQIGGEHHGKQHLLSANAVHFLPDDFLDLLAGPLGWRQQGEDAVGHLADVTAAQQIDIAGKGGVGRLFLIPLAQQLAQ